MSKHAKNSNGSFHPLSAPDFLPLPQLRDLQLQRLRTIVQRAYDRVALFRKRMDERGMTPQDLRTLDDITKLPFAENGFDLVLANLRYDWPVHHIAPRRKVRPAETWLLVFRDKDDRVPSQVAALRGMDRWIPGMTLEGGSIDVDAPPGGSFGPALRTGATLPRHP